MASVNFANLVDTIRNSSSLINYIDWPENLTVPVEKSSSGWFSSDFKFWINIKAMRSHTDSGVEAFKKKGEYRGSTGWEYEMIMGHFHKNFYYSKIKTTKSYEQVTSKHSFKIEDNFNYKAQECVDNILIDDYKAGEVKWIGSDNLRIRNQLISTGKYTPIWVMNFHTHPLVLYPELNKQAYTFFSSTDLRSFTLSNMFLTGLVTDRLWILAKTPESREPSESELKKITYAELGIHPDDVNESGAVVHNQDRAKFKFEDHAAELMRKYNIVLYCSNGFSGNLRRLN